MIFGAVDTPTASVIGALLLAAGTLAARVAPKTRSEAGVDRSTAHKLDVDALSTAVNSLGEENERLTKRVQILEEQLDAERRECDTKIAELDERLQELRRALLDDRAP